MKQLPLINAFLSEVSFLSFKLNTFTYDSLMLRKEQILQTLIECWPFLRCEVQAACA